jgi:DNA-binding Lrp family transcriptional regulator
MDLDDFDRAILSALQKDASLTNARLGDLVHLSTSQCSRRRIALEQAGYIERYTAKLSARKLGYTLQAITRVNLAAHSEANAEAFGRFVARFEEILAAYSVSGDADYILHIHVTDLEAFADFIHRHLLPHPTVAQVRSDIVLMTLKDNQGLPLRERAGA